MEINKRRNSPERTRFIDDLKVDITDGQSRENQTSNIQPKLIRFTSEKGIARTAKEKQKNSMTLKNKVAAIALTAVLALGGIGAYAYAKSSDNTQTTTIEQAINEGESLETLGISQGTYDELKRLQNQMSKSDNLSDLELVSLAQEIYNFSLDSAKEKVINELGLNKDAEVLFKHEVESASKPPKTYMKIEENGGKNIYYENFEFGSKTMSTEIGDYIRSVASLQTVIGNNMDIVKEEKEAEERGEDIKISIERQAQIDRNNKALEKTEKMLSGDISRDEAGNIKYQDITKAKEEQAKKAEEQKRNEENKPENIPVTMVQDNGEER